MTDYARHNLTQLRRHGTPATLTRAADASTESFVGVYLSANQNVQVRVAQGVQFEVNSNQPWIWIDLTVARPDDADGGAWTAALPRQGDRVAVAETRAGTEAVTYEICDFRPDGYGGAKLILRRYES